MHQYTLTCSLKSALGLIVAFQSHLCPSSFHQQLGPPWSCWTFGCWQTVALPRHCPLLCGDLETGQLFLDTQVSLAPTHVSWLVGWLVSWLVTLSDFQSLVSNGRSNKKSSKNKVHLFSNFASGRTLPTHENVYEGLNALKCI